MTATSDHNERVLGLENNILRIMSMGSEMTASAIAKKMPEPVKDGSHISTLLKSMSRRRLLDNENWTRGARFNSYVVYSITKRGQERADELRRGACPDDGTCHHNCLAGECFRVHHAGPMGRGEGDWTEDEIESHSKPSASIDSVIAEA